MVGRRLLAAAAMAVALGAAGAWESGPAPDARLTLRLPGTSHDVGVEYRQLAEEDLADYRASGDETARRAKQLQALLAFSGRLTVDVPFKVGDLELPAGRLPLAFTVDADGDLRWFVVEGQAAHALPFTALEPGFDSPRLTMQLQYVTRSELRLVWHLGARGGLLTLRPGRGG